MAIINGCIVFQPLPKQKSVLTEEIGLKWNRIFMKY